ncbi:hypothetical protein AKJ09_08109 [Labilithrix luteola]|uniref:Uncharacterized protein n=1 Tax=Labilithrix luteola TaxID=1391654 RepID=A0A0K1Q6I1_9BACT|nr:hypothetical protein AKJ09_08109 [Labilithrix luteola]
MIISSRETGASGAFGASCVVIPPGSLSFYGSSTPDARE